MACRGTLPAVVHLLMFLAFDGTCVAGIRANSTDCRCKLRITAHVRRGRPAQVSTVHVEADAIRQSGHLSLTQAGIRTLLASLSTSNTGIDTVLKFSLRHKTSSLSGTYADRAGLAT